MKRTDCSLVVCRWLSNFSHEIKGGLGDVSNRNQSGARPKSGKTLTGAMASSYRSFGGRPTAVAGSRSNGRAIDGEGVRVDLDGSREIVINVRSKH